MKSNNDEEYQEAIEYWRKEIALYQHHSCELSKIEKYAQSLLNLIDEQKKENKALSNLNNNLITFIQNKGMATQYSKWRRGKIK